jgi:hypothetical protein
LKEGMAALTVLLVARAMQATAIEEPNDWKIGRSKRKNGFCSVQRRWRNHAAQAYRYLGATRTTCNLLCEFCQRR